MQKTTPFQNVCGGVPIATHQFQIRAMAGVIGIAAIGAFIAWIGFNPANATLGPGRWTLELVESNALSPATTVEEAQARAMLLHETIQGALRVMHRDFFDSDNPDVLPSQALEDVFSELAKEFDVRLRWLTVDGDEMSVHHRAENDFEREAIGKIAAGAVQHSSVVNGRLEYVGRIRLVNQCLKCHVRQRLNLNERSAGLGISVPIDPPK